MTEEKRTLKEIFRNDGEKYYQGQLFLNAGVAAFVAVLSAWMFIAFGDGTGSLAQTRVMVFLTILLSPIIQIWAQITNSRQDLLRDRWYIKEEPREEAEAGYVPNPWRLTLLRAIAVAAPVAAITAAVVPLLGQEPFHAVSVGFVIGIPLFAVSSVLTMVFLPRDQEAFAAALTRKIFSPVPPRKYLLVEHILPWLPIQGIINFGVGMIQFPFEAQKAGGAVPINVVALDAGFVFALIAFLSWVSSQVQVRPDVRLGRIHQDAKRALSLPLMLLAFVPFYGFALIAYLFLLIFFGPQISPLTAAVFKAIVVMAAVIPGCIMGAQWGRRRETALWDKSRTGEQ